MIKHILIAEDDVVFARSISSFLTRKGFTVNTAYNRVQAQELLVAQTFDLLITDLKMPDGSGIDLLSFTKERSTSTQVILMTNYADVRTAVEAMKQGALDYISKPFRPEELLMIVEQSVAEVSSKTEPQLEHPTSTPASKNNIVVSGMGESSKKFNEYVSLVGPTEMCVLIQGESGTGKEVAAKAIHNLSDRGGAPFVPVDCGAIPKEIAASEFFGHVKGSFTGAVGDKKGHFEAADGGTLFLDEVGNLSYENQIQLLRALQERKIKPVGSNTEIEIDVRILSATNENLLQSVADGSFREDLYHRLNEFTIQIPSLHQRKEDLYLFIDHFLIEANQSLNKKVIGLSKEVEIAFRAYTWPGNLRELKNVIKRSVLLTKGSYISLDVIPQEVLQYTKKKPQDFSTKNNEKQLILNALEEAENNKSKAANLLQITRKTLYNKMERYGITN